MVGLSLLATSKPCSIALSQGLGNISLTKKKVTREKQVFKLRLICKYDSPELLKNKLLITVVFGYIFLVGISDHAGSQNYFFVCFLTVKAN